MHSIRTEIDNNMVIKKLERVSTDKNLVPASSGTEDWQKYYKPKVVK